MLEEFDQVSELSTVQHFFERGNAKDGSGGNVGSRDWEPHGEFPNRRLVALDLADGRRGEGNNLTAIEDAWDGNILPQAEGEVNRVGSVIVEADAGFPVGAGK